MADPLSALAGLGGASSIDTLVSQYMALERRPVDALKASEDQLDIRSGMFSDLKARIDELKELAENLASGTGSVFGARLATSSDTSVATATAADSAAPGSYLLENVVLARAARMHFGWVDSGWNSGSGGSFTLNGTTITLGGGKSLAELRDAINGATYAEGRQVVATIVNNTVGGIVQSTLVLEGKSTGAANTIDIADAGGGAVIASLGSQVTTQTPLDASFTINGVAVTREENTALSDVVSGITINLKGNAASVSLEVANDTASMRSKIEAFLQKYNTLADYLRDKSATTKNASGNYTRGLLYGYSLYTALRSDLPGVLSGRVSGLSASAPSRLADLGIEMDANMHFAVKDSTKLDNWLATNSDGVRDLFGGASGVATRLMNRLEPYVEGSTSGAKSYVEREQDAIVSERALIDGRISQMNERLAMREAQLREQFARLQAMFIKVTQQQQQVQSIFSSISGYGLGG